MVAALGVEALAFWPVWRWYARRIAESPEELWAVAALITALCFLLSGSRRGGSLLLPSVGLAAYALSYVFLSPVFRAALASLTIGLTVAGFRELPASRAGVAGLLAMSTPAMASLEFVAGFPLRVIAAKLSVGLVSAAGFAVDAQGTMLSFGSRVVEVDAPCSGVRMLWAGLYLAFTLSAFSGLGWLRTGGLVLSAVATVVSANAMRASSLFFLETGLVPLPGAAHEGAGVAAFLMTAGLLVGLGQKVAK